LGRKARPFEHSINAFLRFEQRLNSDAFRKALFHVEAKRTAFKRIDTAAGKANGLKARMESLFTIDGPREQIEAARAKAAAQPADKPAGPDAPAEGQPK
jgi:hypothetical protein